MRGLAILLVIQSHLAVYYAVRTPPGASRAWVDHWYFRITNVGWSGVDLFFVLSGFLITGILLDAKQGAHYFRSFYARRFLRIFPVYYGFLFFVIVIVPHISPLARTADVSYLTKHQWLYWTYLDNIFLAIKQLSPAEGSQRRSVGVCCAGCPSARSGHLPSCGLCRRVRASGRTV